MSISTRLAFRTSETQSKPLDIKLPVADLLGCSLVNASMQDTLAWLCRRLHDGVTTRVAFLNAHCANVRAVNRAYAYALNTADAVLPDGSGVALGLRMVGQRLAANLNGTDLIPALCKHLAASGKSVFLLGGKPGVAQEAAARLKHEAPGLKIAGCHHGYYAATDEARVIREINASGADALLVALGVPAQDVWLERHAGALRATLMFGVGGLFDFLSGRIPRAPRWLRSTGMEWTYRLYQEPARMWRRYIVGNPEFLARCAVDALPSNDAVVRRLDLSAKRAIDVAAAACGLVMAAPLLALVAAAIRLDSKGPALLRQTRIGQDGAPFTLFKFRSMSNDAEARRAALVADNTHGANGVTFKMKADPRITRIGKFLRRSSIDELPQLLNVFNGTMSLVGPRPPLPAEVVRYTAHQRRRLASKPGITCLWQVSGRANLPFAKQVELDIEYLSRRNVGLDLLILARTVPAVLLARGAY